MAATTAKAAYGSKLKLDTVAVVELTNISGPSQSAGIVDITNHDSPDGYEEILVHLRDAGPINVEGNWTSDVSQDALKTKMDLRAAVAIEIHPVALYGSAGNLGKFTFSAFITGLNFTGPMDGVLGFTATFKVTGPVTYTAPV